VQAGEGEDVGRLATLGAGQLGGGDPLAERQRPLALLCEAVLGGVAVVGQHAEVRVEPRERLLAVVLGLGAAGAVADGHGVPRLSAVVLVAFGGDHPAAQRQCSLADLEVAAPFGVVCGQPDDVGVELAELAESLGVVGHRSAP
jgi:hypothetical protein